MSIQQENKRLHEGSNMLLVLNTMSNEQLDDICQKVVLHIRQKSIHTFSDDGDIASAVQPLVNIFTTNRRLGKTADELELELTRLELKPEVRKLIISYWIQVSELDVSNLLAKHVSAGKLVDIQWRLGMGVSSDSCRNLNHPFIVLSLTVQHPDMRTTQHVVEMSLSQFKNFYSQLKDMASVMAVS